MRHLFIVFFAFFSLALHAQLNPAIKPWLQNTTQTGTYYIAGNSNLLQNNILVNCQKVQYSTNWVYVTTTGVPAYPTGPFQDGNPSQATNQNAIFKIPLNPVKNTGTPTPTTAGNIGVFINGVALYDYRDGVAWNNAAMSICGGPGNPPCPGGMGATQAWNRDAIPAEKPGFDCAKGHPANGNYHHHQNPSAFDLDLNVISNVCNLYDADGLYAINPNAHSPLLGFAYDGFPIYGAYGYKNVNGTGGITRIKSSYQLKNHTSRTNGPAVGQVVGSQTFFNGYFREDYEYVTHPNDPDYLDEHNGRFCVTPEYPQGIYCYFATVDDKHNSAYPYVVGPTFYGTRVVTKVTNISEPVTVYAGVSSTNEFSLNDSDIRVFPNPASDLFAVQIGQLVTEDIQLQLINSEGKTAQTKTIHKGSTLTYFDLETAYPGIYFLKMQSGEQVLVRKVVVIRD